MVDLDGAFRLIDVVFETEATIDSDVVANGDGFGAAFQRRGSRAVWDFPGAALRLTLGDVASTTAGFQEGIDVLGVGVRREYALLRPTEIVRPRGDETFTLTRASSVEVIVNGVTVRQLNLQPGTYDLDDIPLTEGANDVVIVVRSDTGQEEVIRFSQFFRGDLLAEGVVEFAVAAGVDSDSSGGSRGYDVETYLLSAWIDFGLTDEFTVGVNAQGGESSALVGADIRTATILGNVKLEGAGSWLETETGETFVGGRARLAIDKKLGLSGLDFGSIGVFADYRTIDFATISDDEPNGTVQAEWGLRYSIAPWDDISLSVGGAQRLGMRDGEDEIDLFAGVSGTGPYEIGWSVNADYQMGEGDDEYGVFFSLSRSFGNLSTSASYSSEGNAARINADYSQGSGVGAWDVGLGLGRSDDEAGEVSARFGYTGAYYEASAQHDTRFSDFQGDDRSSSTRLQIGMSFAFAGDSFGVGRPINGSFAIVEPDASLEGRDVVLRPNNEGGYDATSGAFGPAVIGGLGEYGRTTLTYDVPGLPAGYNIGSGLFELEPPYKAGYALRVATEAEVTVMGVLKDDLGRPVSLVSGRAVSIDTPENEPIVIFTNKSGRFALTGAKPGAYELRLNADPPQKARIDIPEGAVGIVRLGEVETEVAR